MSEQGQHLMASVAAGTPVAFALRLSVILAIAAAYVVVAGAAWFLPPRLSLPLAVASAVGLVGYAWLGPVGAQALALTCLTLGEIVSLLMGLQLRAYRMGRLRAEELLAETRHRQQEQATAAALLERERVARDVHDVLAHSQAALAAQLQAALRLLELAGEQPALVHVRTAHELARQGLLETRRALAAFRGETSFGGESLRHLVRDFEHWTDRSVVLSMDGELHALPPEMAIALYRVLQEALTNSAKHSSAGTLYVTIERDEGLRLLVLDPGPATEGVPIAAGVPGYGLDGMADRARLLGGSLRAGRRRQGFEVELWLPGPG
jgi:signal transduction histidine kinase